MKKIALTILLAIFSSNAMATEKDFLLKKMTSIYLISYKTLNSAENLKKQQANLDELEKHANHTPQCQQVISFYRRVFQTMQTLEPNTYKEKVLKPVIEPITENEAYQLNEEITKEIFDENNGKKSDLLIKFNQDIANQAQKVLGYKEGSEPSLDVCN